METRINLENYTFCIIKSLEHLKFKKWPHPLFRPGTNHACHQKPNPSRETVPSNSKISWPTVKYKFFFKPARWDDPGSTGPQICLHFVCFLFSVELLRLHVFCVSFCGFSRDLTQNIIQYRVAVAV
jgi:hypothetical protein